MKVLRKIRKVVYLLVLVGGLNVVNTPFSFTRMFATESDYEKSVAQMTTFIVAAYQKQGNQADLESICKTAKKLDKYGMKVYVENEDGKKYLYFVSTSEPPYDFQKKVELK